MHSVVFGIPGRFAGWCERIAVALIGHARGTAELIRGDTLAEVALNSIGVRATHAVVSSRQPGGRLRAALAESERNFIVALDDPRSALIDMVLGQGIELAAAVQGLASSCAALASLAAAPHALTLRRELAWRDPIATARAVARHLDLVDPAIDEPTLAALVASCAAEAVPVDYDVGAWWSGLAPAEQELAIGALQPFVDAEAARGPLSVTWRHDLFFAGDRPEERARGPIDITGRARCVLHGPYIMLPPGAWSLSLTALFTRAAAEHEFLAEICADRVLAAGTIRPQREGTAGIALDFVLDPATERPLTLRLSSRRAAFDGAIEVIGATLTRSEPGAA